MFRALPRSWRLCVFTPATAGYFVVCPVCPQWPSVFSFHRRRGTLQCSAVDGPWRRAATGREPTSRSLQCLQIDRTAQSMTSAANTPVSPLPWPPRAVRLRDRARNQVRWAKFCTYLGVMMTIPLLCLYLTIPLTYALGGEANGSLEEVEPFIPKGKRYPDGVHFLVTFSYQAGGKQHTGHDLFYSPNGESPKVGQQVTVLVLSIGPFREEVLRDHDAERDVRLFAFLGELLLIWCAFFVVPIWLGWIGPTLHKRLVSRGICVVGTVTAKTVEGRQTTRYLVSYSYVSAGGRALSRYAYVTREVFDALPEGQPVLVLYSPGWAESPRLYETLAYQVEDRLGTDYEIGS